MDRTIKLLLGTSVVFLVIHTVACSVTTPPPPSPTPPSDQSQIAALVQLQLEYLHAGDWEAVYATCNPIFRERYQRTPDEIKAAFTSALNYWFEATPVGIDLRNPRVVPTVREGDFVFFDIGSGQREYSPISEGEVLAMMFDVYEHDQLVSTEHWKPFAKVSGRWYDHGPTCR